MGRAVAPAAVLDVFGWPLVSLLLEGPRKTYLFRHQVRDRYALVVLVDGGLVSSAMLTGSQLRFLGSIRE